MSYRLCGWHFRSAFPVASLPPWDGPIDAPIDIMFEHGAVTPADVPGPVAVVVDDASASTVHAEGVGRFAVRDGRTVVADILPDTTPGAVETIITGAVLGVLAYQRGVLPLHGNTAVIDGQAIAICGRSGTGKSTLASALLLRGHRLISDDVLPIVSGPDGYDALVAGNHIRLWAATLTHFGQEISGLRRAANGEREKYFLPTRCEDSSATTYPLKALVWLQSDDVKKLAFRRLDGIYRAQTVRKSMYRPHIAESYARLGVSWASDLSLPRVEVYDMFRPRGLDKLDEHVRIVESIAAA